MTEILDVIHKTIYQYFDVCGDDEEVPMSDKDKLLLEVNKAICNNLKALEREPCEDAVSRQAVTDTTICDGISCNECSFNTCEDGQAGCLLKERVDKIPPVNPQPKTGHWIRMKAYGKWACSECCTVFRFTFKEHDYCPNCGAKMAESEEEKELKINEN